MTNGPMVHEEEKKGRALAFGAMTTWNDLRMKV